ncbi:MAG: cytochrome c biogenesis CcdA family protein [Pseudonocardia sp.]
MDVPTLAFALVAGAVAAFNPCGFALLPAYLGLLVAGADGATSGPAAVRRAVRFAAGMTVGFVAVFGLVGVVAAPLIGAFEQYLPVLTLVIGVALVGVGVWLLAGRSLAVPGLAGRGRAPGTGWWSQVGYGASFAVASLSCTIGPFVAVTAGAVGVGDPAGVAGVFVAYALGMGVVVLALAVAVALARASVVARMRRAGAVVGRVSGALLVVAGAYVAWYGWFELRALAGGPATDPVVSAAAGVQEAIARAVIGLGAGGVLALGTGLLVLLAGAVVAARRGSGASG